MKNDNKYGINKPVRGDIIVVIDIRLQPTKNPVGGY